MVARKNPKSGQGPAKDKAAPKAKKQASYAKDDEGEKPRKVGRPSDYSLDEAMKVCAWLAEGKSLRAYCRQPGTPGLSTVFQWRAAHKEFADHYAQAREDQADTHADEILDIADNQEIPADSRRIMVDARKWIASKLKPRTYGDKVQTEVTGSLTLEQLILASYNLPSVPPADASSQAQ